MSTPPFFQLSSLDGDDGFAINGKEAGDRLGFSISGAGDVNGDGIDDLIVGAYDASPSGDTRSGESYVIFGTKNSQPPIFNLANLNGSNGFAINGVTVDENVGTSVSAAGDINGDGIDDLIIGADVASPINVRSGRTYIVFGKKDGFTPNLSLSALNGSNGFVLNGVGSGDRSGFSVSGAGDINGDGVDDLVVGAPYADPSGNRSGQTYVVFGKKGAFPASLRVNALDGTNGFTLNGITVDDYSGKSVSSAGDINGDGIADLAIGALGASPNGSKSGQVYIVFGKQSGFAPTLSPSTLNGSNGFVVNGIAAGDRAGFSVSDAGDINGDGIADLIIGASGSSANGSNSGQSYVVFGKRGGFAPTLNLSSLNGSNGFAINGAAANDGSGFTVSGLGDVNADGIDDLIAGSINASPNGSSSGRSHVVFGKRGGFAAKINLSALNGSDGFAINGSVAGGLAGVVNRVGDFNGDGINDIAVGAPGASPNGASSGRGYVIFGTSPITGLTFAPPLLDASKLTLGSINTNLAKGNLVIKGSRSITRAIGGFTNVNGTSLGDLITGDSANNVLVGNAGDDVLLGGGGRDTLTGGAGRDKFSFNTDSRFTRSALGIDTITDFKRVQDKIELDRSTFTTLTKKTVSFEKVQNRGAAKKSKAQITYIQKTGSIFYNSNGEKAGFGFGGLFADVKNGLNLTARDFTVVP